MKDRAKKVLASAGLVTMVGLGLARLSWNTVLRVSDGDTFVLGNKQEVRLLGIDAPELQFCGGERAKKELEKLVLGKRVKLTEVKADRYGRILALVYTGNTLVNEKLIESGWVRWDGTNNNLGDKLVKVSDKARELKLGVYGEICRVSEKPGCVIKGNIGKQSGQMEGGKRSYFFPGCSEYEATVVEKELGEEWFCSEKEAIEAGYEKATNCFGKGI